MNISVKEIAEVVNGEIRGNADAMINHPAKIETAQKGAISFLANMKYEEYMYKSSASAILIRKDASLKEDVQPTLILVEEPYTAFVKVLQLFNETLFEQKGISELSYVHPEAKIGKNVTICPFVSIEKGATIGDNTYIMSNTSIGEFVQIGSDCHLYPNVTIYHQCVVGNETIIHSGTVIGGDGFGFAPKQNGTYDKVPQVGNVEIGNGVEIGSNCSIDRATMGSTILKDGVKLDNLIQIAHNVVIEENTVIAAQAGISGSTKVGKQVIIGGQAGFVGHISIADGTKVNAQSGVSKSIEEPNQEISGTPAFNWRDELKSKLLFRKLPELEQRIRELEAQLKKQ